MTAKDYNLTQKELKRLLHYNPDTGIFTRLISRGCVIAGSEINKKNYDGYIHLRINKREYFCHRLAFLYMDGATPPDETDHINRERDDNRWCNLRLSDRTLNNRNQRIRKDNKSGYRGICWHKLTKKWMVKININGKGHHLGIFNNIEAAKCKRIAAELKYNFYI